MKKLLSILLAMALMLSMLPAVYAASEYGDPIFSSVNGADISRAGQKYGVRVGISAVWGEGLWGTNPETKTEITTNETTIGNEGTLPASGGITGETKVYWIKTAKFGSGITDKVINASSGTFTPSGVSGNNLFIKPAVAAVPADIATFTGKLIYEVKVRFDDFNARRDVFVVYDGNARTMMYFDENGDVYANDNGSFSKVSTWEEGTWYDVKMILSIGVNEKNYCDYYIDGKECLRATYKYTPSSITEVRLLNIRHTHDVAETVKEYSNSYLYSAAAYATDLDPLDATYTSGEVERGALVTSRGGNIPSKTETQTYCSNARVPSADEDGAETIYKFQDAIIPTGFDGLSRVYMMQTMAAGKDIGIYARGFDFTGDGKDHIVFETKVRFDDTNTTRQVFYVRVEDEGSLGGWYSTIKFVDKGIYVDHKTNGLTLSRKIGTWTPGEWYNVKLVLHKADNLFDVYIDDELMASNLYFVLPAEDIYAIYPSYHSNGDADVVSTSFVQYAKVYYEKNSAYESPVSHINVSGFKKLNTVSNVYEDTSELTEGTYAVEVDILNNESDTAKAPTFVLALYNGNRLVNINLQTKNAVYPSNIQEEVTIDVEFENAGEYTLKAFIWNDDTLVPMDITAPAALSKTVSE